MKRILSWILLAGVLAIPLVATGCADRSRSYDPYYNQRYGRYPAGQYDPYYGYGRYPGERYERHRDRYRHHRKEWRQHRDRRHDRRDDDRR